MHMLLLNFDLISVPLNIISPLIAFISSYAIVRYQITNLRTDIKDLKTANSAIHKEMDSLNDLRQDDKDTYFKIREKDQKAIDQKFTDVEYKRELLKDVLTSKIHEIDKKVSEMHAIIVHKK